MNSQLHLKLKANNIPCIEGKPVYCMLHPLCKVIIKSSIAMVDICKPMYGCLHLITITSTLPNGLALVVSVNCGTQTPWAIGVTSHKWENYSLNYPHDQEQYLSNQVAQEALKDLIIACTDKVYL